MANDAFALSPISASSALPSEADYHAISEAFMETSRGRWFLKEYARRNRNADTAMVLEAVERIEGVLAAQKQPPAAPVVPLAETIAAVQALVESARSTAAEALTVLNADDARAPTRKGLRIILEIAWRLREIGYDNRICDILEAQANTIGANQDALAALQTSDTVLATFDTILRQLGELAEPPAATPDTAPAQPPHPVAENVVSLKTAAPSAPTARATPASTETPPPAAAALDIASEPAVTTPPAAATASAPASPPAPAVAETAVAALTPLAEPAVAVAEASPLPAINASLAAPVQPVVAPEPVVTTPQPAAPVMPAAPVAMAETAAPPSPSPSLGDALLARGMVTASRPQPLAAILRMSQAEKIAFFS